MGIIMKNVTIAAIQMACNSMEPNTNIIKAERFVRAAKDKGANIILLPELFETKYFCQERNYEYYNLATDVDSNPAIKHFSKVCAELSIVMPVSFFEKSNNTTFNSIAMIDADGSILGIYRKTHIPDDHYYQEKFYFTPGNTGFKVWDTAYGKVGVGICWDQWFPEAARCMTLMGADILMYPTAIGSEPILECDSQPHWRRVMQGHAAANIIPIVAANRIGKEDVIPSDENGYQSSSLTFYGSSFITDETGEIIQQLNKNEEEFICATVDLDSIKQMRLSWGLFRDRRPECYNDIHKA